MIPVREGSGSRLQALFLDIAVENCWWDNQLRLTKNTGVSTSQARSVERTRRPSALERLRHNARLFRCVRRRIPLGGARPVRPSRIAQRHTNRLKSEEQRRDIGSGSHVSRFFLGPDQIPHAGITGQDGLERVRRESVETFDPDDRRPPVSELGGLGQ